MAKCLRSRPSAQGPVDSSSGGVRRLGRAPRLAKSEDSGRPIASDHQVAPPDGGGHASMRRRSETIWPRWYELWFAIIRSSSPSVDLASPPTRSFQVAGPCGLLQLGDAGEEAVPERSPGLRGPPPGGNRRPSVRRVLGGLRLTAAHDLERQLLPEHHVRELVPHRRELLARPPPRLGCGQLLESDGGCHVRAAAADRRDEPVSKRLLHADLLRVLYD